VCDACLANDTYHINAFCKQAAACFYPSLPPRLSPHNRRREIALLFLKNLFSAYQCHEVLLLY